MNGVIISSNLFKKIKKALKANTELEKELAKAQPNIEDEKKVFFKTVIPSRRATKKYLVEKK